jgi:hypothetical protein
LASLSTLSDLSGQELSGSKPATEYVAQAQKTLAARRSIRADIVELDSLTNPPVKMSGTYLGAGLKLRLEYQAQLPGGAAGSLKEICDGERLWSLTELPGSKRLTRRDVRQILTAVETSKVRPERAAAVDLALGGLPALLASVQRSMQFDAMKAETLDGRTVTVVQGKWRPEWQQRLQSADGQFPPHLPERVRITFASETQFPERILYLKQSAPATKSAEGEKSAAPKYKALLDLRFQNVVLDGPVDDREFEFAPPENLEPEDITRQYLDQLFPPETPPKKP